MSEPGSGAPSEEDDRLIGRSIAGKFVIERRLGAGAMGAVYRAHQTALDRPVAIKVLHGRFAADATYAARLHLEAKAVSRLDHPNLIRVFDFGREPDGLLYIVMEYLDCKGLLEIIAEGSPLPQAQIVDILSQILSGLAEAHDAGVLHRDIKPENIMVLRRTSDDGGDVDVVKLCDFGIAKVLDLGDGAGSPASRKLTSVGLVIGTPEYMSPEQARGEAFDARSDVYAVGVVLYKILTGRLPFVGGSAVEIVFKAMNAEPEALDSHGPTAAPALDAICRKAISRRPEDRYQSAREMRAALGAVSGTPERRAAPVPNAAAPAEAPTFHARPELVPGGLVDRSLRGGAAAALVVVVVAGTMLVLHASRSLRPPLPTASSEAPSLGSSLASTVAERASSEAEATVAPSPSAVPPVDSRPRAAPTVTSRREGRRVGDPSFAAIARSASLAPPPAPAPTPSAPLAEASAGAPSASALDAAPLPAVPPALTAVPQRAPAAPTPAPDPASARVMVGAIRSNSAAVTSGNVGRAVEPLLGRFTLCYRNAVASGGRAADGASATLHVETDEAGYVTVARLAGDVPSAAARCIESLSREMHLAVDTGTANVDLALTFSIGR